MTLANRFSLARLFLTPVFVLAILHYREDNLFLASLPLVIFLTAVATDAVDGFVARRYRQTTRLGTMLDPLADKFLLVAAFVALTFTKSIPPHLRIPPWVLIIVLTRDIFIVIGASIIYMTFEDIKFRPSLFGKITAFFQMMTVLSILSRFKYSYLIWSGAAAFTVVSGIHYLIRANGILNDKTKHIV